MRPMKLRKVVAAALVLLMLALLLAGAPLSPVSTAGAGSDFARR